MVLASVLGLQNYITNQNRKLRSGASGSKLPGLHRHEYAVFLSEQLAKKGEYTLLFWL